ncbi:head-tail connector protein [Halomonas smyrnensis]|uniref:head-tail connector protein n=1 Tax=Halomonas smyrnensis TaxID=720605 RepID=UPI000304D9E8|nr:head-tail connector protein [Halomonas smyrnensis]
MLELDIIKQHVRLESDDVEEDTLLDTYATAARRMVEHQTGRNLFATKEEIPTDADDSALVLDDDLTTAMLLLIGHWYENREAVALGTIATELPMAVQALISPYRHFHID